MWSLQLAEGRPAPGVPAGAAGGEGWIEWSTLSFTGVAATASVIGLVLTYLNYRAREKNELPKIELFGEDSPYYFRLEPRPPGWKVVRVKVFGSAFKCLAQRVWTKTDDSTVSRIGEWSDSCDFPNGAHPVEELFIDEQRLELNLEFICLTPSRRWWNAWLKAKKTVSHRYIRGKQIPLSDHPHWKLLTGRP